MGKFENFLIFEPMIWTVLNAFARILPGYPWGLFLAFPSSEFQPHLQLALFLFLALMELNKSNLELERAQAEMRDINLRLREVEMELKEAKKRLFEAIRAQVELRKLKRKLRQDEMVWRYKTDSSLKMAEGECIENLKKRRHID